MRRLLFVLPVFTVLIAVVAWLGCDDYNVVEPRFYSESDLVTIWDCYGAAGCPVESDTIKSVIAGKIIPSTFGVDACWVQRDAGDLAVWCLLPISSHVKLSILRSSGAVEVVVFDTYSEAGIVGGEWLAEENGVYGISMQTPMYEKTIWFEVEMEEE